MRDLLYVPPGRVEASSAIGLFVPEFSNPVFAALAEAMEMHAARERARDDPLQHARLRRPRARLRAHAPRARRRGDGLHLRRDHRRARESTRTTRKLLERGARLVFVNGGSEELDVTSVGVDERAAGRIATEHLIELGHERIGFVAGHGLRAARPARRRSGASTRCAPPTSTTGSSRTRRSRSAADARHCASCSRSRGGAADRGDLLERPHGDRRDAGSGGCAACACRRSSRSSASTGSTRPRGRTLRSRPSSSRSTRSRVRRSRRCGGRSSGRPSGSRATSSGRGFVRGGTTARAVERRSTS